MENLARGRYLRQKQTAVSTVLLEDNVHLACESLDFLIDLHFTCLSIQNVPVTVHFDHSCACFCVTSIYRCITKLEILIS